MQRIEHEVERQTLGSKPIGYLKGSFHTSLVDSDWIVYQRSTPRSAKVAWPIHTHEAECSIPYDCNAGVVRIAWKEFLKIKVASLARHLTPQREVIGDRAGCTPELAPKLCWGFCFV